VARQPSPREAQRLLAVLRWQLAEFDKAPEDARQLVPPGTKDMDVKQLAAWTTVARVLLNLDEFITRE
jgi:hypothetical protein